MSLIIVSSFVILRVLGWLSLRRGQPYRIFRFAP